MAGNDEGPKDGRIRAPTVGTYCVENKSPRDSNHIPGHVLQLVLMCQILVKGFVSIKF